MREKSGMTRRGFVAGATMGATALISGLQRVSNAAAALNPKFAKELGAASAPSASLKLHRNESPYGLAPSAAAAAQTALEQLANRYPIDEPKPLQEAIAKQYGVDKEMVALGCGSIEILKMATEAFCSPARPAVVAEPTFEAVVSYSRLMHSHAIKVPLTRDHKHDLIRMAHMAGTGAGMVFLCNPSNPAGTYVNKGEVERFVHRLPRKTILLADEAYLHYVDEPDYESCLRYVKDGLPVVVSRTFSKIYGMAGLRVGYAIGRKDLIAQMTKRSLANNPNQVATAAALAALKADDAFVDKVRRLNAEVRDYTYGQVRALGLSCLPSQTNFVTIEVGRPVKPLIEALKKRNVIVGREFPSILNHMRVTLGTRDEMDQFLAEFKALLNGSAA